MKKSKPDFWEQIKEATSDVQDMKGFILTVAFDDGIVVSINDFDEDTDDEIKRRLLFSITKTVHGD